MRMLRALYQLAKLHWKFQCCLRGWHTLTLVGYIQAPVTGWGRVEYCLYCDFTRCSSVSRAVAEAAVEREPDQDLTHGVRP